MEKLRPQLKETDLNFSKIESGIQYPEIFLDDKYQRCISLATQSKGDSQRYGSVLEKDGNLVGEGYNRAIAHFSFGTLKRHIRQGYANHAEVEAMNFAIDKKHKIKG